MSKKAYKSMESRNELNRRDFLKKSSGSIIGAGAILSARHLFAEDTKQEKPKTERPPKPKTNIDEALKIPKTKYSLPGLFPGRVIEVHDEKALIENKSDQKVIDAMFEKGMTQLTGKSLEESFPLFFSNSDVVGIKVNPVGEGLISTRPEVVSAIVAWLVKGGLPKKNIIIWDRFNIELKGAGFNENNFPGIAVEALQTMDEEAAEGKKKDDSAWLTPGGKHISEPNFDKKVYYWADVEGPKDKPYLNQHVFNGKYSYFGKLVTQKLTKIINVPVFKNTGNGISMATKNLGYGAICNTGRLHQSVFFDVCVEVLAFPAIRDKLVLNITDGLRGQYDGGPMPVSKFVYPYNTLFFATDPFALDMISHTIMVEKRKSMNVKVNEHPMYTDYLRYAQKLQLGITDPEKIQHIKA
jgi:Domain of unknown function (DUF362)